MPFRCCVFVSPYIQPKLVLFAVVVSLFASSQAMYNAKLAPLLAARSEMSELLLAEDEGNGEPAEDGALGTPRGKDGGGKVSHGDGPIMLTPTKTNDFRR